MNKKYELSIESILDDTKEMLTSRTISSVHLLQNYIDNLRLYMIESKFFHNKEEHQSEIDVLVSMEDCLNNIKSELYAMVSYAQRLHELLDLTTGINENNN